MSLQTDTRRLTNYVQFILAPAEEKILVRFLNYFTIYVQIDILKV